MLPPHTFFAYHFRMSDTVSDSNVRARAENVWSTVRSSLDSRGLLDGVKRLGIAVSGGADSIALLHLMLPICSERDVQAVVLHFDHGIRNDSEEDARFVANLAAEKRVPFVSERMQDLCATKRGLSIEMAAREARLAFFAGCAESEHLDAIATGHQADDVAETLLLRLARGAGASGLAGLRPRTPLAGTRAALIRPLLAVSDSALRDWLRQQHLVWREDATNADQTVPRNFVRKTLLPLLEQNWTRDLRARLCQSAEILREDDALLDTLAQNALRAIETERGLDVAQLNRLPPALGRRVVRSWLFKNDLPDAAGCETILRLIDQCRRGATPTWREQVSRETRIGCCDGFLRIIRTTEVPSPAHVRIPGTVRWGELEVTAELSEGITTQAFGIGRYPAVCTLNRNAALGEPLTIRSRCPGDRIAPTGFCGSKKIQDLFVDAKIPEERRTHIPVFVFGNAVAWVPGYRIAQAFAVPSEHAPSVKITVREIETSPPPSCQTPRP